MFQRKPVGEIQRRFTVQLPVSLDDFLEDLARCLGVSKNAVVKNLVEAVKQTPAQTG